MVLRGRVVRRRGALHHVHAVRCFLGRGLLMDVALLFDGVAFDAHLLALQAEALLPQEHDWGDEQPEEDA